MQEIERRSEGVWRPSPGSVYPALQLLEDEGLVRAEETDGRKLFHLTDAGREAARPRAAEGAPWEAAQRLGGLRRVGAVQRRPPGRHGDRSRSPRPARAEQIAAAREVLNNARRALYGILAEDEPTEEPRKPTPGRLAEGGLTPYAFGQSASTS